MECSYHNPYVMPELAETKQTFCNKVMFLQDWSHHYRSFMVAIITCGSLWCIHVHHDRVIQRVMVFLSSFVYPRLDFLWATRRVYKTRGRLPYQCIWSMLPGFSGVRVAHLLSLLCMYDFSYFMFFVRYVCFPYLVFVPGLHSFDNRYNLGSLDYS